MIFFFLLFPAFTSPHDLPQNETSSHSSTTSPSSFMNGGTAVWCKEENTVCTMGMCFCINGDTRLLSSASQGGDIEKPSSVAATPLIEKNNPNPTLAMIEPCGAALFPWGWIPILILGLLTGSFCFYGYSNCSTRSNELPKSPIAKKTRGDVLLPRPKYTKLENKAPQKTLYAQFTDHQFRQLCANIDMQNLIVIKDTSCFTTQGPYSEIMFQTILEGWELCRLVSFDETLGVAPQDPQLIRQRLQNKDSNFFPVTGYFLVESDEFASTAKREALAVENKAVNGGWSTTSIHPNDDAGYGSVSYPRPQAAATSSQTMMLSSPTYLPP